MEQRVKRGADSYKRAFKEALDNGSMSRRKLAWSEPWDWERAKQGVRAASRAMPFRIASRRSWRNLSLWRHLKG